MLLLYLACFFYSFNFRALVFPFANHYIIVLSGKQTLTIRNPGEMIGPAAVFSISRTYPCDIVSLDPVTVMMFRRDDVLTLMQKDLRILENFTTEIASATYLLQQRLELFSYSGIAQKAAFWLLIQARKTGKDKVRIPGSISKWAMLMNVSRTAAIL